MFIIFQFSFGSNRGLHGRHLNNETLWGAWYSGLQTVAFMPPQVTQIDDQPPGLPLTSLQPNQSHSCSVQRHNIHAAYEDSMLETDSQTDGSTQRAMHLSGEESIQSSRLKGSKMRGARPKSSHYRQHVQTLTDSSSSTPFHCSPSAVVSRSPSRKRGKSCDRLENGCTISPSDAHSEPRHRMPKTTQQYDIICHDTSVSFDSTCTEETTSSSGGGLENRNHHHSGHRILSARHIQTTHGTGKRQQPLEDQNIFNEFLEDRLDSGISNSPREQLPTDDKRRSSPSMIPESTSSDVQGIEEESTDFKPSKELGKRGKLQRSVRITDDEFTPRKKSKEFYKDEESFDLETENDNDGIPTDSNTTPTRFMLESTNGVTMKSFKKGLYSSVSPGSFDGLDDDGEGDVAYIDDDVDERDLHGDLLNWLTLSDAPRQGHNEHDL